MRRLFQSAPAVLVLDEDDPSSVPIIGAKAGAVRPTEWRVASVAALCPSYPRVVAVPRHVSDEQLAAVASFRFEGKLSCFMQQLKKVFHQKGRWGVCRRLLSCIPTRALPWCAARSRARASPRCGRKKTSFSFEKCCGAIRQASGSSSTTLGLFSTQPGIEESRFFVFWGEGVFFCLISLSKGAGYESEVRHKRNR